MFMGGFVGSPIHLAGVDINYSGWIWKKTVTTANYRYNLYLLKLLGMIYVGYNSYQELRPYRIY